MKRVHPALAAAAVAAVVGVAGLWYGASAGTEAGAGTDVAAGSAAVDGSAHGGEHAGHASATAGPAGGAGAGGDTVGSAAVGDISVRGAYLREPASPTYAAAYLSVTNAGSQPDTLLSAYCGAARETTLHDVPGVPPVGPPAVEASVAGIPGEHVPSAPVTIQPGATIRLAPGRGHVMLTGLTGALRPGDNVSLLLSFQRAGQLLVELPVIAIGTPTPD